MRTAPEHLAAPTLPEVGDRAEAIEREWFAAPSGPPNAGERAALWAAVRALGRVMSARYTVGQRVLDAMLPSSMPRQLAAAFMRRRSQ